jgi:hypothetical protein
MDEDPISGTARNLGGKVEEGVVSRGKSVSSPSIEFP